MLNHLLDLIHPARVQRRRIRARLARYVGPCRLALACRVPR